MDLLYRNRLDHYEHPHHAGHLAAPDVRVREDNVLCGDSIILDCSFNQAGELSDLAFAGSGCALSQASMSILSDSIIGKKCQEIDALDAHMMQVLLGSTIAPARLKCAMLGIAALKRACKEHNNQ